MMEEIVILSLLISTLVMISKHLCFYLIVIFLMPPKPATAELAEFLQHLEEIIGSMKWPILALVQLKTSKSCFLSRGRIVKLIISFNGIYT